MYPQRLLLLVALSALAAACSDGGASHGSMGNPDGTHTCEAHIKPGELEFALDGDVLTLSSLLEPDDLVLTREGNGDGLQDTWLALEQTDEDGHLQIFMVLEGNRMRVRSVCEFPDGVSLVAEASGRVRYTDSTIEQLDESHAVERY